MHNSSSILIRNIFHMLCYAFRILRQKNYQEIGTEDFRHVQDMLAAILVRGVSQQLKRGLYRNYISIEEQSRTLRGKLDPYQTKVLQAQRIQQFACTHDEFSADNALNRILNAVSTAMLRSRDVSQKQKDALHKLVPYFSDISEISLNQVQWNRLQFHRHNQSYEMLMNVCYMAWQSLLPAASGGTKRFSAFEEDSLPRLYEKFLLGYYRRHFPMLHPRDKSIQWDIPEDTKASMICLLPGMHSDITLCDHDKTLIIDAKFYQKSLANFMNKTMLHSANLYQIFTYVKNEDKQNNGSVSGMLLYAKTTEETEPYLSVMIGGNRITVRTLDLNRSFSEIAACLDGIAYAAFGDHLQKLE